MWAVRAAAEAWALDGGSRFKFEFEGTTDQANVAPGDGVNTVFYANRASSDGALAVTFYSYSRSTGLMNGFDVVFFNGEPGTTGRDFVWSTGARPPSYAYDVQDTATHELGHALGLAHSSAAGATMGPIADPGGTWARSLEADDRAGVQFLYGAGTPPPPSLSTIEPAAGWLEGGDEIWIHGDSFPSETPVVVWVGGEAAAGVRVRDFRTLTFVTPPGRALGPADVVVRTRGGEATLPGAFRYEPNPVALSAEGFPSLGATLTLEVTGPAGAPYALYADLFAGHGIKHGLVFDLAFSPRAVALHDGIDGSDSPLDSSGAGRTALRLPSRASFALRSVYFQAMVRTGNPSNAEGLEQTRLLTLTLVP